MSGAPLPAPSDPEGTMLGDVHVVIEGPAGAPAVALVHGIPGSTRDFRYLGPALAAQGLRAVRIDLPGHGKTPARAFASTRVPDRAVFVQRVMRALGHDTFALVGHSFGGGIVTHTASLFAEQVTALVCINSLSPRRHRGYGAPGALYRASTRLLHAPVVGDAWHRLVQKSYAARGLKSDIGLEKDTVRLQFLTFGGVDFKDLRIAASRVRAPALVVSSHDDPLVEPACAFALVRSLARSPLVSHIHVPEGGHFLQKHQAPAIASWLKRSLTTSSSAAA